MSSSYSKSVTLKTLLGNDVDNTCDIRASSSGYTVQSINGLSSKQNPVVYACEKLVVTDQNGEVDLLGKIAANSTLLTSVTSDAKGDIEAKSDSLIGTYGNGTDAGQLSVQTLMYTTEKTDMTVTALETAKGRKSTVSTNTGSFTTQTNGLLSTQKGNITTSNTDISNEKSTLTSEFMDLKNEIRTNHTEKMGKITSKLRDKLADMATSRSAYWGGGGGEGDSSGLIDTLSGMVEQHQTDMQGLINVFIGECEQLVTATFETKNVFEGVPTIAQKLANLHEDITTITGALGTGESEFKSLQTVIEANSAADELVTENMSQLNDNMKSLWDEMIELSAQFHDIVDANSNALDFTQFEQPYIPYRMLSDDEKAGIISEEEKIGGDQ